MSHVVAPVLLLDWVLERLRIDIRNGKLFEMALVFVFRVSGKVVS